MADINYLNPTSIAPKFDWQPKNALAGMSWVENRNDYRNLMEQQMRLQAIAEQERRMELEQKQKEVPLQDLLRQGKMNFAQGQAPYQHELGATGAQAGIATNQIQGSPEGVKAALSKFVSSLSEDQYRQYERGMKTAEPILAQALQLAKTPGGEVHAQQFVKEMYDRAKQAGIDVPPMILDPRNWEPLYQAAVETPQYRQEIGKVDRQGMHALNRTETEAAYSLQRGRENNQTQLTIEGMRGQTRQNIAESRGNQFKFSLDQNINRLVNEVSSIPAGEEVPVAKVRELATAFEREYEKFATQGVPIRTMAPDLQKTHITNQRAYVMDRLRTLGIKPLEPQQQTQNGQKADPLGLR